MARKSPSSVPTTRECRSGRPTPTARNETFAGAVPAAGEQAKITAVDDCMLRAEFLHFMGVDLLPQGDAPQSEPSFDVLPFDDAARAFLDLYRFLTLGA